MKRRGEMRREMRRMKGRRGEVEMSSQGNEGDRMAIEEDQNGVFWSLLVDLYTEETRFKAEPELYYESLLRSVGRSVRRGRWGVCPECRQGVERICRAISKQVQWSDAGIEVDVMHTRNECTE
jgi:hypothetical protein